MFSKIPKPIVVVASVLLLLVCFVKDGRSQTVARVIGAAEGVYWNDTPKPWFTRQVAISNKNRKLPVDDHDESLPTLTGYYYKRIEASPFTRYPFKTVVVKRGLARFTTKAINGTHFVFRGVWGTAFDEASNIHDVPFMKGTLYTYKKGKLIKKERLRFGHAVNA